MANQRTHVAEFIRHLATALATASLYSAKHQQVRRLTSSALASLQSALADRSSVSLMVVDEDLIWEGSPLENTMHVGRLVKALKTRGIGHLKFQLGLGEGEFSAFVAALIDAAKELSSNDHIRFGRVAVRFTREDANAQATNGPSLEILPELEVSRLQELYEETRRHQKLRVKGVAEVVSGFVEVFSHQADPLLALAPLRVLDEYTFTHSTNVCILNLAQAMAMGISGPQLQEIGMAAMLHDIGKLFIPEEVINKPGALTDEEWHLVQQHPVRGAQRLLDTPGVSRLAVVTAFEHHLKYDLSGYPKVSAGWQQNLCSQMTTISDFFDALRTKRSYRGPVAYDEIAAAMLDKAGKDFHPVLTRNFIRILDRLQSGQGSTSS